ncbi:S10 family serine carboxypeptidase-like protein [Amycolatopsis jejuensis]|uniref:S10 family serine carboxypeptidase-like protein n=1 Tax=Amycolatopsis jejuensis TaxID=330084 RepID=UPI00052734F8|nr:hypothetical protein [Amycolatopsis jejuensis]
MEEHYEVRDSITADGRTLPYRFALDLMPVRDETGAVAGTASVFSYLADVPDPDSARPVVFAFNGGPGSSSVFLHLSGLGPKYAALPDDPATPISPPYALQDSQSSLLPIADLVFIDPVNTGFGRFSGEAAPGDCYSVDGDARYFADLVLAWTTRYGRWDSPKYLLGESYGTVRAPALAHVLLTDAAMPVDGILLVSQAANILDAWDRPGNVAGAVAALPTKAVTAWFHGLASKQAADVEEVFDLATEYAYGEFASALMKVNLLTEAELSAVAQRLEHLTGLAASTYVRNRLWVSNREFCGALFADSGKALSQSDARYALPAGNPALREGSFDAVDLRIKPAFAMGARQYLHDRFEIPAGHEYRLDDADADEQWDFTSGSAGKPSPFSEYPYPAKISQYLKQVTNSRLFLATGHYDMMATTGMAEHLVRQYDLPLERVISRRYPAGHMMYVETVSRRRWVEDIRAFLAPTQR